MWQENWLSDAGITVWGHPTISMAIKCKWSKSMFEHCSRVHISGKSDYQYRALMIQYNQVWSNKNPNQIIQAFYLVMSHLLSPQEQNADYLFVTSNVSGKQLTTITFIIIIPLQTHNIIVNSNSTYRLLKAACQIGAPTN